MQAECRGYTYIYTMLRRSRFKPSDNRKAMLGKLSSLILGNDCANRAQSAYLVCTMLRCSQSKRHNLAVGSCRKLSLATDKYFAATICVTHPLNPPPVRGTYCCLWMAFHKNQSNIYTIRGCIVKVHPLVILINMLIHSVAI